MASFLTFLTTHISCTIRSDTGLTHKCYNGIKPVQLLSSCILLLEDITTSPRITYKWLISPLVNFVGRPWMTNSYPVMHLVNFQAKIETPRKTVNLCSWSSRWWPHCCWLFYSHHVWRVKKTQTHNMYVQKNRESACRNYKYQSTQFMILYPSIVLDEQTTSSITLVESSYNSCV